MPSPGEDYQSWSVTAGNNGTADPLIDWHEGQTRASVNNSARSEMAAHAKNRNLLNGSIVTTGTANAQQFLSGLTYTTIPTGLVVRLKIGSGLTNTDAVTLNMDGLGDTLVKTADGRSTLGHEFIGDSYADLLYNGTNWIFLYSREFVDYELHGGGGIIIGKQIFDAAGTFTYTPTAGMECCIVECIGGGGGGGAALAPTPGWITGGGGGSGGYSRSALTAAAIGSTQTVTVGAAGLGGPGDGSPGGASSLGTLVIANGGGGAGASNAGVLGLAGTGGVAGTGDIAAQGAPGGAAFFSPTDYLGPAGPSGGSSAFGGGGRGTTGTGDAAGKYGSGGAGSLSVNSLSSGNGGNGSAGVVIVTEFAGRGGPGRDGDTGPVGPPGPAGAGTGDVLVSGTPVAGQVAQWLDTSHIKGVNLSSILPATSLTTVQQQVFTANGTYTPTTGMQFCILECLGGGAGGGGVAGDANYILGGAGGGAGGYSRKRATAADIGASKAVTVGTGGAGGPGAGGLGGDSSVGSLCVARGGGGGGATNPSVLGVPGAGGVAGTGDVAATGASGTYAVYWASSSAGAVFQGGSGANSYFGGGGRPGVSASGGAAQPGGNANGYAAGGGGANANNGSGFANGGSGSPGLVIITEFCN